jgi:hypothetical protein
MAVPAHYAETDVVARSHTAAGIAGSTAIRGGNSQRTAVGRPGSIRPTCRPNAVALPG